MWPKEVLAKRTNSSVPCTINHVFRLIHTTQAALTSTIYIHAQGSKSICSKALFRHCCLPHCSCQRFLPSACGSRSAVVASSGQILPGCFFRPEAVTHRQQSWFYFSLKKQTHPLVFTPQPKHHHTAASHKPSLRNHAGGKIPLDLTNIFSIQCRKQIGEFSPTGIGARVPQKPKEVTVEAFLIFMRFNLQSNQSLCSSHCTLNSSIANSTAGTSRVSNTSSWDKWKDVPVVSETAATSSDHTHLSPYHFCHPVSRFGPSIIFLGFQELLHLHRTSTRSYWVWRGGLPSWRHNWRALRGRVGAGSSSGYKGRNREARGNRVLSEERVTDSLLLTQMSGGNEEHWLVLPLPQVRNKTHFRKENKRNIMFKFY